MNSATWITLRNNTRQLSEGNVCMLVIFLIKRYWVCVILLLKKLYSRWPLCKCGRAWTALVLEVGTVILIDCEMFYNKNIFHHQIVLYCLIFETIKLDILLNNLHKCISNVLNLKDTFNCLVKVTYYSWLTRIKIQVWKVKKVSRCTLALSKGLNWARRIW